MNDIKNSLNGKEEIDLLENLFEFIIPKFREAHDIMVSMLDFQHSEEIRVADLGCGFGLLSKRILETFPNALIFGLDNNLEILARDKKKLNEYSDQFIPFNRDLNDKTWFTDLSSLHAVISSFALDYLPLEKHKELIKNSYEIVDPRGRWISCEFFRAQDQRINRVFHDIEVAFIQGAMKAGKVTNEQIELLSNSTILRQNHYVCEIDHKIEWLKDAGFKNIEIPWRFLNIAIISAIR